MATTAEKVKNTLIIEYVNGVDDDGNEVITRQRFSKIKLDATDDAIYAVAQAINPVLVSPVLYVTKQVDSTLDAQV